jgi:hypothetical protein
MSRAADRKVAAEFVHGMLADIRAGRFEKFANELGQRELQAVLVLARRARGA